MTLRLVFRSELIRIKRHRFWWLFEDNGSVRSLRKPVWEESFARRKRGRELSPFPTFCTIRKTEGMIELSQIQPLFPTVQFSHQFTHCQEYVDSDHGNWVHGHSAFGTSPDSAKLKIKHFHANHYLRAPIYKAFAINKAEPLTREIFLVL